MTFMIVHSDRRYSEPSAPAARTQPSVWMSSKSGAL
jgi:hypothetical protein